MAFIGIDLHSNCFTASTTYMGADEKIYCLTKTYYLDDVWAGEGEKKNSSFQQFLNSLKPEDYILVEASTNAFWFHDQVAEKIKACYVYESNKARREGNKTDILDAKTLAKKLSYFILMSGAENDLPTVYIPKPEIRELRSLFSTYNLYKKMRVQIKNRIYSILKENGIFTPNNELAKKGFIENAKKQPISSVYKYQIENLFEEMTSIEKREQEIRDMIILCGSKIFKEEIKLLLSIIGFSSFTAIALMADVIDISRFSNFKKFCSYLRAAPKVTKSNKKIQIGSINKASRSTTVTLLTQSLLHFKKAGEQMNAFYYRVKQGKSAGKARMALIRKILVSVYFMLKRRQQYYWVDKRLYNKKLALFTKETEKAAIKMEKIS